MRRLLPVALFAAALLVPARPAAWGAPGHHIISIVADTRLTPEARRAVSALLGTETLVTVSTWADQVRGDRPETSNWHFVNIPYGEARYDATRDCAAAPRGDCVIAAIARFRNAVRDTTLTADARLEALKFIVHFVGDLHQPLHAIDNRDRGGNDVRVAGDAGRATTLHAVWDSGVIQRRGLDAPTYARLLLDDLVARPLAPAQLVVDVVRWAESAHRAGVESTYAFPEFTRGASPPAPIRLDDAYYRRAQEAVDRQLLLGGVHLAALLNEMFGR
jgi:S1/P1 Nuclease